MQLALRPYVTTGVALVGASVIAAAPIAPITPAEVQIPNPAVQAVERGVQLTANEIQTAVNRAIFAFVARPTVAGAELLGQLLEPILGEEQAALLPLAALGFAGPLISGGGSVGTALQNVVDSDSFEELLTNLIGGVGTIIDGSVNGGYGPDLFSLVGEALADSSSDFANALAALDFIGAPPPAILAGGLINLQGSVLQLFSGFPAPPFPASTLPLPVEITLPGTIPTLQGLVEQLFGLLGGSDMAQNASLLAASPPDPRRIENGVNDALYAATAVTLALVTRAAPLLEPILGDDAAQFLAIGTLGFIGPLIGGTGGLGHAVQDLVDSDDLPNFLDNALDLARLPIDGAVNGGRFGPNLQPLLPFLPTQIPIAYDTDGNPIAVRPVENVFAPGLIPNANYSYPAAFGGIGLQPIGGGPMTPPDGFNLTTVGTIPTLQGLVGRVFDSLPSASAASQSNIKVASAASEAAGDGQKVEPKKRNRPLLNLVRHSLGADEDGVQAGSATGASGRHRIGTPVRDLINKVVNGGHNEKEKQDEKEKPAEGEE